MYLGQLRLSYNMHRTPEKSASTIILGFDSIFAVDSMGFIFKTVGISLLGLVILSIAQGIIILALDSVHLWITIILGAILNLILATVFIYGMTRLVMKIP